MLAGLSRLIAALLLAGCGWMATEHFRRDAAERRRVEEFVGRFELDIRHPSEVASLRYVASGDLAADIAADMAVRDAFSRGVSLKGLDSRARSAWLRSVANLDAEIAAAELLVLSAAARRPGRPYHWSLLGQLSYAASKQSLHTEFELREPRWRAALDVATDAAPQDELIWGFLAAAYLDTWSAVAPAQRQLAMRAASIAMIDPDFTRRTFAGIASELGIAAAAEMLPDHPAAIRVAMMQAAPLASADEARLLLGKWEKAEWKLRVRDLDQVRERDRHRDVAGLRSACASWAARHSIFDFDLANGRRQVAEVLEHWPATRGDWSRDKRAEIVAYLFDKRMQFADRQSLIRTVNHLAGAPAAVRARAQLFAGEIDDAIVSYRQAETRGSFEWTPFLVELVRWELAAGKLAEARATLETIPPAAREECDVLVAELDLATAEKNGAGVAAVTGKLAMVAEVEAQAPLRERGIPLCITDDSVRRFQIVTDQPGLVSFGWNGGKLATVYVDTPVNVSLPAPQPRGRHLFNVTRVTSGVPFVRLLSE